MSSYAVFFDYNGTTYRLPTNPETVEISKSMATEEYNVLGAGPVIVPTGRELTEYSFACEFPSRQYGYVETKRQFLNAGYYERLFESWRDAAVPVRLIITNKITDDINTKVVIESLDITETAGEEGDKWISFQLKEYREINKKIAEITSDNSGVTKEETPKEVSPAAQNTYTVMPKDSLWSIAKKLYGDGSQYPKIYEANRDIIKNPAVIRAGQILNIPG